jgi:hypothetical protein
MYLQRADLFNTIKELLMSEVILLGIMAGIFQLVGYTDYYKKVAKSEVDPNPLTWLMFAYGTFFLFILEWDKGATVSMLLLPVACSIGGIGIAIIIWWRHYRNTKNWWPNSWRISRDADGYSFLADLVLTAAYLVAGLLASVWIWTDVLGFAPPLSSEDRGLAALWVLILSNASTFPGFAPIIRETKAHPEKEHHRPWFIWTLAYALLLVATWMDTDLARVPESLDPMTWTIEFWTWLTLMSYPASNMLLHGMVAWYARPLAQQRRKEALAVA